MRFLISLDSRAGCLPLQFFLAARHVLVRAFDAFLAAFRGFTDFSALLARGFEVRFVLGTFPMRGSRAAMSSQARNAALSKSCASAGSTCQSVTSRVNTRMDRRFGNSRRKLSWCSL